MPTRKRGGVMHIQWGKFCMAVNRQWLVEGISQAEEGGDIGEIKLMLAHPVTEPVEAQVHGLALFWPDRGVSQTCSTFIVTIDGCGRLRVAEVTEGSAKEAAALGVSEGGGEFRLGRRGTQDRDAGRVNINGGVTEGGGVVTKYVVTAGLRAGFGEGIVGGVELDLEEHGGGSDNLLAIGAESRIAEEAVGNYMAAIVAAVGADWREARVVVWGRKVGSQARA